MTPEAKVKRVVTKHLKSIGAYYFFPATGGYGKSGVPDIVGCFDSKFLPLNAKLVRTNQHRCSGKTLLRLRIVGESH